MSSPRFPPPLFTWEPGGEEALEELPEHLRDGVRDYLEHGLRPGQFLSAVISYDLVKAVEHADHVSSSTLCQVVRFFLAFAPSDSVGSREKLEAWLKRRSVEAFEVNVSRVQEFYGKQEVPMPSIDMSQVGVSVADAMKGFEMLGEAIRKALPLIANDPEKWEELRVLVAKSG